MQNQENQLRNTSNSYYSEDNIDSSDIFNFLKRNTDKIAIFSLFGVVVSGFFAITTKRTWQGEFQIVLEKNAESMNISPLASLATSSFGLNARSDKLETEVGILKSPSVLMNVYDIEVVNRNLKNKTPYQIGFKNWRDNVSIKLQKKTSILNVLYKDKNKELILPVLNRISNIYQEYSGKKRLRGIQLDLEFYDEQVKNYKIKSDKSSSDTQKYAMKYDLLSISDNDKENLINIEQARVEAANNIRLIFQNLIKLEEIDDQSDEIIYFASSIYDSPDSVIDKLREIDIQLTRNRAYFRDKDRSIKNLLKDKKNYIKFLKIQLKSNLLAQKELNISKLKAAEREPEVLIKYRKLLNSAAKDKLTLSELENSQRALFLEKARSKEPWKLITKPTLLPYPIAPVRKNIVALGLISGFIFGSIFSYFIDKRTDYIFSLSEIQTIVGKPIFSHIKIEDKKYFKNSILLLINSLLTQDISKFAFLILGDLNDLSRNQLSENLDSSVKNNQYIITDNLIELKDYSHIVVVISIGLVRRKNLVDTINKLLIQKKMITSLLILDQF